MCLEQEQDQARHEEEEEEEEEEEDEEEEEEEDEEEEEEDEEEKEEEEEQEQRTRTSTRRRRRRTRRRRRSRQEAAQRQAQEQDLAPTYFLLPFLGRHPAVRRKPLNPGAGPGRGPVLMPEASVGNRRLYAGTPPAADRPWVDLGPTLARPPTALATCNFP